MYRLSFVLTLVLAALSVAAADTDREDSHVIFESVVVMREMVPVEALGGYRAFHLAVIRSQAERRARPYILAEHRYFGADGQTAHQEALARWTPLALGGDPEATSNLGVLYDLGLGVVPDQARAVRLYRRAAEQGFVPAWNNLDVAYALGRGVARDDAQAVAWLRKAAEHGVALAQWASADGDGLRKAAERGFALAQNTLGVMYLDGRWGLRDDGRGSRWVAAAVMRPGEGIFKAANRNITRFLSANDYLKGLQYAEGRGVPQDPLEAYKWFELAAGKGHPQAAQQKADITEAAERASLERWTMSSVPEDELKKEKELIGRIGRRLCEIFGENDWQRVEGVLKNSSKRFLGRELTLDRAYRHLRCNLPYAENIDLIRVAVEAPASTKMAWKHLIHYFTKVSEDPFLLGKIVMCRRDFGADSRGCVNVFEQIEDRKKDSQTGPVQDRLLSELEWLLRQHSRILTHNGEFCREYFLEEDMGGCQ